MQGRQLPTSSNIENWWEGMIDDVIMHGKWRHLWKVYYKSIPEFVRKRSLLTVKLLKQTKIFEISMSESRIYKEWQTLAIIREITDSILETGRNGSKPGVSRIIRESWQPCVWNTTVRIHLLTDVFGLLSSRNCATMATWHNDFCSLLTKVVPGRRLGEPCLVLRVTWSERVFVSDTSPKCINREGLGRRPQYWD